MSTEKWIESSVIYPEFGGSHGYDNGDGFGRGLGDGDGYGDCNGDGDGEKCGGYRYDACRGDGAGIGAGKSGLNNSRENDYGH